MDYESFFRLITLSRLVGDLGESTVGVKSASKNPERSKAHAVVISSEDMAECLEQKMQPTKLSRTSVLVISNIDAERGMPAVKIQSETAKKSIIELYLWPSYVRNLHQKAMITPGPQNVVHLNTRRA